ncbi:MAG: M28 family peptidase [Saprospiraceae bacterium]|nr:M28 family peptidase [Saprospiraceae bacterium]
MKRIILVLFPWCLAWNMPAQTNIISTNNLAEQVMLGNYESALFAGMPAANDPSEMAAQLSAAISADSLKAYILQLSSFYNRNAGSDTISTIRGIGAARNWTFQKFNEFSASNNQRLISSFLQFDQNICAVGQHKNIFAVLPGAVPSSGVVLIEGHIDSRCAGICDTACIAEGVEDNATGTALVLEMARVMSKWQFNNTIVFLITTAEEQGLYGALAFANYVQQKSILLRAVFNNDVIGGVLCGQTSSAPSCPGLNHVDSTSVRLFSNGGFNSKHKQLARFIKLQYQENVLPTALIPMNVRVMAPEDRSGRGGDHIPFRQKNYTAMRFTAANEHGNASNTPDYTDRQHTSSDVLGEDHDHDGNVDSFFVDFNYLARNTLINANAATIAARNVAPAPGFSVGRNADLLVMQFDQPIDTQTIRIALRTSTNDWDTVYTISPGASDVLYCNPSGQLFVSVAGVDSWGNESFFSTEKIVQNVATEEPSAESFGIELYQNRPNPFDEATWISFFVHKMPEAVVSAHIQIADLQGKTIKTIPVAVVKEGMNEVLYTHGYGVTGAFVYSLIINGVQIASKQMIFAN